MSNKFQEPVKMTYTNYRGVTSIREIIPIHLRWDSTKYHPEPQWIMAAHDVGRNYRRDFALSDCNFTKTEEN